MEQKAFDEIKRSVAQDILLAYLYFNKHFDIHTDVSYYHLGIVISQNGKPIAFYRRKLTGPQTRYTTCSIPRRPLFLHTLSFECNSKLCGTFLNQFLAHFHI